LKTTAFGHVEQRLREKPPSIIRFSDFEFQKNPFAHIAWPRFARHHFNKPHSQAGNASFNAATTI
jgi:hypothetical protein